MWCSLYIGRDCWTIEDRQKGTLRSTVQLFLGYMLSLDVALPVLLWIWASRDTWEDPYDLMNEMDAFMCALYALHEIFIHVWYCWLYIRGVKKHRLCEHTSMSQKCVATHQMCYLFICNLKTNQTFHHPSMDMDEQNRMGTSRYWCLRGYYNRGRTDLV